MKDSPMQVVPLQVLKEEIRPIWGKFDKMEQKFDQKFDHLQGEVNNLQSNVNKVHTCVKMNGARTDRLEKDITIKASKKELNHVDEALNTHITDHKETKEQSLSLYQILIAGGILVITVLTFIGTFGG